MRRTAELLHPTFSRLILVRFNKPLSFSPTMAVCGNWMHGTRSFAGGIHLQLCCHSLSLHTYLQIDTDFDPLDVSEIHGTFSRVPWHGCRSKIVALQAQSGRTTPRISTVTKTTRDPKAKIQSPWSNIHAVFAG